MNNERKLATLHFILLIIFWVIVWLNTRLNRTEEFLLTTSGIVLAFVLTVIDFIWIIAGDEK